MPTWTAYWSDPKTGLIEEQSAVIDAAGAAADGEWFSAAGIEEMNIEVTISNTATVSIDGSNAATVPANSTDGFAIVSDVTATGTTTLEKKQIPRWMKIHVHAWTSGTVDVDVVRRRRYGMS